MLNFNIADRSIPAWVFLLQVAVGILVPVCVAAVPIARGTRVTVLAALSDYGVSVGTADRWSRILGGLQRAPRTLLYAIRNAILRRSRLALTLATLASGGAIFIAAMNIGAAMEAMVEAKFKTQPYGIELRPSRPQDLTALADTMRAIPGVAAVEGWAGGRAWSERADGSGGNAFAVQALPPGSALAGDHEVIEGRWLLPADTNALVVNQVLLAAEGWRLGDRVTLVHGATRRDWTLVGVVRERMSPPMAFVPYDAYAEAAGMAGLTNLVMVSCVERTAQAIAGVARQLERELPAAGIPVSSLIELADFRKAVEDHLVVIARLLVGMAFLVVLVGGLGLISAMSISVLERTREIGVMRAMGASTGKILQAVVAEGVTVGLLSWILAALLAQPVSVHLSESFGLIFFKAPLTFTPSPCWSRTRD